MRLDVVFAEVEFFGFKLKHWQTEPFEADEKVPPPDPEQSEIIVHYSQESSSIPREAEAQRTFLSFKARIHFKHEAGFNYLMRIKVNHHTLKAKHSVNKDIDAELGRAWAKEMFGMVGEGPHRFDIDSLGK